MASSSSADNLVRNVQAIANVEAAVIGERSTGERIGRAIIKRIGRPAVVLIHLLVFAAWMLWNSGWVPGATPFDHPPFSLLSTVACLEGILLGILILSSQNRLQHEADRRAHLTLQINMMAEAEGTKMLQMLDAISMRLGIASPDTGELLDELKAETDPEAIVESLNTHLPAEG